MLERYLLLSDIFWQAHVKIDQANEMNTICSEVSFLLLWAANHDEAQSWILIAQEGALEFHSG